LFVIVFVLAVIYLEYITNSIGVPAGWRKDLKLFRGHRKSETIKFLHKY